MATTISLPTAHDGGSNMDPVLLEDGNNNTNPSFNASNIVIFSAFSSLSVPSGATVNGIEVIVNGQGSTAAGRPTIKVGYSSTLSSSQPFSGDFTKSNALFDPGWGSSSNLWGLSWTPAQAEAIVVRVGEDYGVRGVGYWDFIKVRVTYTEGASGPANLTSYNGVAKASITSINGITIANVTTLNGIS